MCQPTPHAPEFITHSWHQAYRCTLIYGQNNLGVGASPAIVVPYLANFSPDLVAGNVFEITLLGNITIENPTYGGRAIPQDGTSLLFRLIQDATGNRILTLANQFTIGASVTSYTLSTAAGAVDYIGCLYRKTQNKWDIVSVLLGY